MVFLKSISATQFILYQDSLPLSIVLSFSHTLYNFCSLHRSLLLFLSFSLAFTSFSLAFL